MSIPKSKALILGPLLLPLFFFSGPVFSGEAEPAAAEKAAPGKEGEGKGEEHPVVPEWYEVQARISSLEGRITAKKQNINNLIEEKQHLPEKSSRVNEVIREMVAEHKELMTLTDDYNKEITIYKFRYPERGAKEGRKYNSIEIKPLDQMEQELGLNGRLNRNMTKIRSQYNVPAKADDKTAAEKPAPETQPDPKSLDDAKVIIIKK